MIDVGFENLIVHRFANEELLVAKPVKNGPNILFAEAKLAKNALANLAKVKRMSEVFFFESRALTERRRMPVNYAEPGAPLRCSRLRRVPQALQEPLLERLHPCPVHDLQRRLAQLGK